MEGTVWGGQAVRNDALLMLINVFSVSPSGLLSELGKVGRCF